MENTKYEWQVIGQSVRGASHFRSGLPNQDAITWSPKENFVLPQILVIADGHGSSKSFRSDQGSKAAISAARLELQHFIKGLTEVSNLSMLKRVAEEKLPQTIVRRWQDGVKAVLEKYPFTKEELETLKAKDGDKALRAIERNPLLAYGTTLLAVLVTETYILYLQIGDGDIITVSDTGEVTRPIEKDEQLIANETTSLCAKEAWNDVHVVFQALSGQPPALIMASTDGYANSFTDEQNFLKVGTDYLKLIRESSLNEVRLNLKNWLSDASTLGSGDDVTLGIIARVDALTHWDIAKEFEGPSENEMNRDEVNRSAAEGSDCCGEMREDEK